MTEKRFKLRFSKLGNGMITDTQKGKHLYFDKKFLDVTLPKIYELLNELAEENKQLKSTIAKLKSTIVQLIEQNHKNNDLLLSDIRILEKALWCNGCANNYGRLKELRKEFMR